MKDIPDDAVRESWDDVHDKSLELAKMIEAHCLKTGEQYDAIVVVPRGSYYPVNIVARELGFSAVNLLHACIGSYESGETERQGTFKLGQMPTREQVAGKDLLIIEEVCDTGHTLRWLVDWLEEQGARSVKTGSLHYKPGRSQTGFKPDWFVAQTDEWIVYPWEVNEFNGRKSRVRRV